jgi:hypothetical protein
MREKGGSCMLKFPGEERKEEEGELALKGQY